MRRATPICIAARCRSRKAFRTPAIAIPNISMPAACKPCCRWPMPDREAPAQTAFLPYGKQEIGDEDVKAVVEALVSGWLTTGPRVAQFERAFAKHCGAAEAVAVNSGTAALHAAMRALGLHTGDEVIVPAITFAASANAAVYEGATPVFADVDPDTLLIDPASVRARIGPRTKAIVAVGYDRHPRPYESLEKIAPRPGNPPNPPDP